MYCGNITHYLYNIHIVPTPVWLARYPLRAASARGKRAEHLVLRRDELYGRAMSNNAPMDFIFGVGKL